VCYIPGAEFFLGGGEENKISRVFGAILPLIKIFLHPMQKESTPDEKNCGHASVYSNQYFNIFSFPLIYY
jgi:hypothetical protein